MQPERRKKTFTAAVLNIVAYSIYIVFSAVLIFYITVLVMALLEASSSDADVAAVLGSIATLIGSYVINIILDIICLILSCKCIKISKMSVQDYASKKSIVSALFVMNIIVVCLGVIGTLSSGISWLSLIDLAIWAMLIVSTVFFAIDLKENQKQVQAEQAQVFESVASSTSTSAPEEKKEENVEQKIEELNKMKADGLITDEEFEKLKQDLMK